LRQNDTGKFATKTRSSFKRRALFSRMESVTHSTILRSPSADALRLFYETPLDAALERHATIDLERHVLALFRSAVDDVPAYGEFLRTRAVDPGRIASLSDFRRVPRMTKADYHHVFPTAARCRGGTLDSADFFAVSSGSTGEPTFWPRAARDEIGTAERFEQVLRHGFGAERRRTLGVVCFALGSWVGGMYTTFACRHVAAKGYALTLVTPGNQRAEILRVVRALAPEYDQVVLFGYPPFLKDTIDAGRADGLDWSRHELRLVVAGEVFSEEWRSLVCARAGIRDPRRHVASLYGTADGGVLANETPLSVQIRRFLADHPDAARELFGESRLPTLCQYDPCHRYFEGEAGALLFSGDGHVPLLRYDMLDRGGVLPYDALLSRLAELGHDPFDALGIPAPALARLPFVYVFGRSYFAVSYYGANVYPENVSVGLEQRALAPFVTGKFVLEVAHDADQNAELRVAVELAPGVEPRTELAAAVADSVRAELERLNSEFVNYVPDARRTPLVRLLPLADPEYFPLGVKHRYTRG